jgi:molecular chaperone HtpG
MQKMQLNLRGLASRFARRLYSPPGIFLRELLQNAYDAIQLRKLRDASCAGQIHVTLDAGHGSISITDDGEGMSRTMIEEYLATLGSSGTGEMRAVLGSMGNSGPPLHGRFGIGLLSAFAVADRVDVHTCYMGAEETWHWMCGSDGEYMLKSGSRTTAGTVVTVTLNPAYADLLEEETVERMIREHADFLPVPIFLEQRGPINTMRFPWESTGVSALLPLDSPIAEFIERHYREPAPRIIPIHLCELHTHGFLFITDPASPDLSRISRVDLYQERMLLRRNVTDMLSHSSCLRGMLECGCLHPNAARDDALRDEHWDKLREALSATIQDGRLDIDSRPNH